MTERRFRIRRPRGWLAFVLAMVTLAAAVVVAVRAVRPHRHRVTLMAGDPGTSRLLVGQMLRVALGKRHVEVHLVPGMPVETGLDEIDAGTIDLMLAPSALEFEGHPHILEAAPLYFEALHLLVKHEIAAAVTDSLPALRGHTVDIGPVGASTEDLAISVLRFAEVDAGGGGAIVARHLSLDEVESLLDRGDRSVLPDAIFHLAMVPSPLVERLVRQADYRLVPLLFADAFRLAGILSAGRMPGPFGIDRADVYETIVPPFAYRTAPEVPSAPLPTLGTRLLLLANDRLSAATVEAVVEAIFTSPFARLSHPPLEDDILSEPARLALHPGTLDYIARNQPFVSDERVGVLSNAVSIIGALGGSALFLWQWRRQRAQHAREDLFNGYMRRLADVSRRVADVELEANLELEPLATGHRQLLELKAEVLDAIIAGELGQESAVTSLLMPINAARDHLAELLLHVRETVEEKAEAEGRTAEAVWKEEMEGSEGEKPPGSNA